MRFARATIALVVSLAFSVHATLVNSTIDWEEHDPVDAALTESEVLADEAQAMAVSELLISARSRAIDGPLESNDGIDFSHGTNHLRMGSFDETRDAASIVLVDMPSRYTNYYYYLGLIPFGLIGFTILKGWQRQRALDLRSSRHARSAHRTGDPYPS